MLKMQNLSYSSDVQEDDNNEESSSTDAEMSVEGEEEREEEIFSLQSVQETLRRPGFVRQPTPYPRSDTTESADEL